MDKQTDEADWGQDKVHAHKGTGRGPLGGREPEKT